MKIEEITPEELADYHRIMAAADGVFRQDLPYIIEKFNAVNIERQSWEPMAFAYFLKGYCAGYHLCMGANAHRT